MKTPCFDGYVALDIQNPLNEMIYSIREAFSDKKMCAMPVDIPIIGALDTNRTVIRHKDFFYGLLDKIEMNFRCQLDEEPFFLETDAFVVNDNRQLSLSFKPNVRYQRLIEMCRESLMKTDIDVDVVSDSSPILYVVLKSHLPPVEMDKWHQKKINMRIPILNISLYHKEAVPLTRLYSVNLSSK